MNDTGRAQVAELARLLTDVTFDAAYTSPLGRTRETAAALLGTRNLEATPVAELVELSYGDLQGTQASAWAPDFRREWEESPWTVTFPNGESLAMVRARAIAALERIVTSHPGQTVLVSSHGHLNRVLALHVFDQSAEDFWAIEQANASVLVLQFPITPQSLETSNDD
jgi:broad specificity phosphatase PhoE